MLTAIEKYLLDIGTEDYSRLWEAVVAHRHAVPSLSEDAAVVLAQGTIRKLLREGFIELYFDNYEDSTEHSRLARELEVGERDSVFASREPWLPGHPSPNRGYAFATTEAGERALYTE